MKNKWVYIIFIVLTLIAAIIYFSNENGTIKEELKDFAVKDTASISRIFMVEKDNSKVLLERKESYWMVNNSFIARPDAIKTLLETIASVSVKSPVGKAALPNIIRQLATKSVKIEIYQGSEKIKVYYVGSPTPDEMGTYMVLENSSVPFITFKPGFFGYLSTRYFTDEELWRDNSIFLYSFKDIASVNVKYFSQPEKSFTAINDGNNSFSLNDYNDKPVNNINNQLVKEFIGNFKKIKCESYISNFSSKRLDSLLKSEPIAMLSVTNRRGEVNSIKLFLRPNLFQYMDDEGNLLLNDPDAMYGVLKGNKQVVVCQYFVFNPLMKDITYFLKRTAS